MSFYEMICFAKVYSAALSGRPLNSVTKQEVDVTLEVLKTMADGRNDWTQEDKECYKQIVDFAKEYIKEQKR